MAYSSKNLSVLAYSNGFTLWHYRTDDEYEDIKKAGYFDEAADMVRPGDLIIINNKVSVEQDVHFAWVGRVDGGKVTTHFI